MSRRRRKWRNGIIEFAGWHPCSERKVIKCLPSVTEVIKSATAGAACAACARRRIVERVARPAALFQGGQTVKVGLGLARIVLDNTFGYPVKWPQCYCPLEFEPVDTHMIGIP